MELAGSMMERAQKMRVNEFNLERNKQLLSGELALNDVNLKQQNLRVEQMRNEVKQQENSLDVAGHTLAAQRQAADNEAAHQKAIADARVENSKLIAQLPSDLNALQKISPDDRKGYVSAWANIQAKYGHLAGDQFYGQQYHTAMAPALGEASMRNTSFQLMVQDSAAQLAARVAGASSTSELAAISKDPMHPYVRQADPNFVKTFDERMKQLNEKDIKVMEAQISIGKDFRQQGLNQNDKFESNPGVQNYRKAQVGYLDAVDQLESKNPTNYTDMAALTSFFKIIDPTMGFNASQEEIFKKLQPTAARALITARNLVSNGGLLTPETRTELRAAIETSFDASRKMFNQIRADYAKGLTTSGNTTDYLPNPDTGGKQPSPSVNVGQTASVKLSNGTTVQGTIREKGGTLYLVDANGNGYPIQNQK
jgi:hypothetical protein